MYAMRILNAIFLYEQHEIRDMNNILMHLLFCLAIRNIENIDRIDLNNEKYEPYLQIRWQRSITNQMFTLKDKKICTKMKNGKK